MTDRTRPATMYQKIWDRHVIARNGSFSLLHVDRHLIHDGSIHAFAALHRRGLSVRRPDMTFGTADHYVATRGEPSEPNIRGILQTFVDNTAKEHIQAFQPRDRHQGIVHVVGPEQGLSLPGMIIVCGDSHTSTHGAIGALAFGIGQSENRDVLATQTVWQKPSRTMRIEIDGTLHPMVSAKDVIMAVIARIGIGGATGYVVEYTGSAVRQMSVEGRLTLCNMTIEAGARSGMVAPDDATFSYLEGRPYAPKGRLWEMALQNWRQLPSDPEARFDARIDIDGRDIAPMVTWGTNPEQALPITDRVPMPDDAKSQDERDAMTKALEYMRLTPGQKLTDIAVDRVFIGSCTNSRIEDLRAAAAVTRGRKVAIKARVVPGSEMIREQAEAEGLDRVFIDAGWEWHHSGCSMCVAMNGDVVAAGERCASTSNRNFEGRQGKGAMTHLMSPASAAATAIAGHLADVRELQ
ncbi:MAG: 3-isopropylmalate dehydratase large subunit [Mesorhizobium sp.]